MSNLLFELHQHNHVVMTQRNGIKIPAHYHTPEKEHRAVRQNILLCDYSHFGKAKISGESAWELLNILVSGDVSSIRDEQAMYTLMLDDEGQIITDLYILCDEESYLLFSEWMTSEALCERITALMAKRSGEFDDIEQIIPLNEQGLLHIEGPYSWELLVELYGMDVAGLPFQEHMHVFDELILLRAGKHGEFSYKLFGDYASLANAWQQLVEAGEKFDLCLGGLDYQQQVRLENPCFTPTPLLSLSRCPIELQLQWMVRYDKDEFIGMEALKGRLDAGPDRRAIGMSIDGQIDVTLAFGDKVLLDDEVVGVVIECGYSADIDKTIGRLFIDSEFAWAALYHLKACSSSGDVIALRTAAVPFARNYSFLINPAEHSYIDKRRPRDLMQQFEWQKEREEAEKAATPAAPGEMSSQGMK